MILDLPIRLTDSIHTSYHRLLMSFTSNSLMVIPLPNIFLVARYLFLLLCAIYWIEPFHSERLLKSCGRLLTSETS